MTKWLLAIPIMAAVFFGASPNTQARELTFEDRAQAQEAIERVYHAHRSGSEFGFESAVPRTLIERKVREYLQASYALEHFWNTPITSEVLDRELRRIARDSALPDRLLEIYDALSGDAELIQECFARPVLVQRLLGEFIKEDVRIDDVARLSAAAWVDQWIAAEPDFDLQLFPVATNVLPSPPLPGERRAATERFEPMASGTTSCPDGDSWVNGAMYGRPPGRRLHSTVWTGSELIVWGGLGGAYFDGGARYDPLTDTWIQMSALNASKARVGHSTVWTGTEMIVWGGHGQASSYDQTGGRYDPASDSWTATSTVGAPSNRDYAAGVWTGSEMIIWGGGTSAHVPLLTGGRYDPATDSWTSISTVNTPSISYSTPGFWTGSEMLVLVSAPGEPAALGGRYDPATDTWAAMSMIGAPEALYQGVVWTGNELIAWGGREGSSPSGVGGRYNPTTDTWQSMTLDGAPEDRGAHSMVWTGDELIVWGGAKFWSDFDDPLNNGGIYDPATDSWRPVSMTNVPYRRYGHSAVWTGDRMIVWGGTNGYPSDYMHDTGGRFDPVSNTWTPTSIGTGPEMVHGHTAVWTGSEMIVWGGRDPSDDLLNTGGRYDPIVDSWYPTPLASAPSARTDHTAVWTGAEMIVWGGGPDAGAVHSGGRFDPAANTWTPTSTFHPPGARRLHTAVWTGTEMIIWGGLTSSPGGRYDPATDSWGGSVAKENAPSARDGHTVVWTGSEMIVWGGVFATTFNDGGRYDPATNSWNPITLVDAPQAREQHTAVWTGSEMIVWGGTEGITEQDSGSRYDPVTDTWAGTSAIGAPSARELHSAVWTGTEMIVWAGGSWSQGGRDTGALYDPVTDSWRPTGTNRVPAPRTRHSAVWTGELMIVWGGTPQSGGRYLPAPSTDADFDGSCGFLDCDDLDSQIWATPGEVAGVVFEADGVTLSWNPPVEAGGVVSDYDVLRSTESADFTGAICLPPGGSDTSSTDGAVPQSGEVAYYLVRANNACPLGSGFLGSGTNEIPRLSPSCQ